MWILFAIGASIFWGLAYVINEKIYNYIPVLPYLAITFLSAGVVMAAISLFNGELVKDIGAIMASPKLLTLIISGIVLLILAEICIGYSIMGKNATIAGLIEISYPLFIAIFSYLLFKENNLTLGTTIGGALIFAGIAVIYAFNR
jgi:drug/metabolite transporter (DMT)-like permease